MPPISPRRVLSAASLSITLLLVTVSWSDPSLGSRAALTGSAATGPVSLTASTSTGTGARAFGRSSYWNTPLGRAPLDPKSARYIRDAQVAAHSQNHLRLVLGDWGMPSYRSGADDPAYVIRPATGPTVKLHIPAHARPMPTSDAALTVTDTVSHQVVCLGGAHFDAATHHWTAKTVSRYWSSSNGIAQGLRGGTRGNLGHRGIPGSIQAVTKKEIRRGAIRHRLEIYWWETAPRTPQGREAYFPMTRSETGSVGTVPEGIVIRIRRSVDLSSKHLSPAALTIATALQRYGAVVGDNSGTGNNLKLQANTDWHGVLGADSLRSIPWSDYVFVKGGYRP
jgi:hypothetical protein